MARYHFCFLWCDQCILHTFYSFGRYAEIFSFIPQVLKWLGIYFVHSSELQHHFNQFTKMGGMPRYSHLFFKIIWFATIWMIWKERNNRVFQNTVSTPYSLLERVKVNSLLWLKFKQVAFNYSYHDWRKHPILCMRVMM